MGFDWQRLMRFLCVFVLADFLMTFPTIRAVPPPGLVCVELNPGPGHMTDGTREQIIES